MKEHQELSNGIKQLRKQYFLLRLTEILFQSLGITAFLIPFISFFLPGKTLLPAATIAISYFLSRFLFLNLHRSNTNVIIRYLNRRFPQLGESADLLFASYRHLAGLKLVQSTIVQEQFEKLYPTIRLPHHLLQSFGIFVIGLAAYFSLSSFMESLPEKLKQNEGAANKNNLTNPYTSRAYIASIALQVEPPNYTKIKSYKNKSPQLTVPEGSLVTWGINFSKEVEDSRLILAGGDTTSLKQNSLTAYSYQRLIRSSGFYQLQWLDQGEIHRSDYYQLEIIKDQSPIVAVNNLNQFTRLKLNDSQNINVISSLHDDYGLTDSYVIATVSKGSGEAVKFREEKLLFTSPATISGKQLKASVTFNLKKLGLEPGDELYFYVEALDNKVPKPNRSRTETFFIALQDTTTEIISTDDALGVDLMPEYFRSQRQIIIDTEKLLRERKKLSRQTFNATSNELGYDQKVLRLRYGQFLGEEDETGVGHAVTEDHNESKDDGSETVKEFGHVHDTENEHNLVNDKKSENKDAGHADKTINPGENEDPLEPFIHHHDEAEEATFFTQSIKAKLKAALTVMWDAELYLRLYEPAKSLPFQYTALNLLKEISNDSRIYVHRTGFDPPPLKEDKRLSADLNEIKNSMQAFVKKDAEDLKEVRVALLLTERMLAERNFSISAEGRSIFQRAGQELSTFVIDHPGKYLRTLSILKQLADGSVLPNFESDLYYVRKTLWNTIPSKESSPTRQATARHKLDLKFLRNLNYFKP